MPIIKNDINDIIEHVRKNSYETPWIEFKTNNYNPQMIGEYISALSNTAALFNHEKALMIWGIDDKNHNIIGTTFDPQNEKISKLGLCT